VPPKPEPTPPPSSLDVRHPRLRMHGPHVVLPRLDTAETPRDLPFAGDIGPRGWRGPWLILGLVIVGAAAVIGIAALRQTDASPSGVPPPHSSPVARAAPSTTGAATTREATPVAPAPVAPAPTVTPTTLPVDQLPPHQAVYRDGKLFLQGTLPNREVAARFRAEADAVIGPGNVVDQYQFDPRVPEPTDGRVRVDDRFLFATDSAAVDPAYLPVFDLGVAVLRLNPQATMRIRGYTDDQGPPDVNQRLSQDRAQAAASYLVAHGIDPSRITVEGLGPADPIAPNDTDGGRAQNRRIEVDLFHLLS
jgi:outer membrane protein OmpA-like peptidoglycan-associated protein